MKYSVNVKYHAILVIVLIYMTSYSKSSSTTTATDSKSSSNSTTTATDDSTETEVYTNPDTNSTSESTVTVTETATAPTPAYQEPKCPAYWICWKTSFEKDDPHKLQMVHQNFIIMLSCIGGGLILILTISLIAVALSKANSGETPKKYNFNDANTAL